MENAVKYRIFIKDGNSFVTESNLEALIANYLAFLSPLIDDFIWQNESFYLVTNASKGLYSDSCTKQAFVHYTREMWL